MKLKEINRTSTIAWSPIQSCQAIATGTVAGALDESFSNTTELEIFKLDWSQKNSEEFKPVGVVNSNARFNRIAWSHPFGDYNLGVIAGGMENGEIDFWNPEKILAGSNSEESLVSRQSNHSGAVKGLEFNPFQHNLLASGAGNGEVFLWNLEDLSKPYTPGPKSQKLGDVTCLNWNRKVQHILATSSSSGYTVIWDLRNRREIMSLGYQPTNNMSFGGAGRIGVTSVAWNPDSATQLVTASEDDNNPIIMLWDVRNANAPEKILSGHNKGVLSLAWCPMDSDLLLSCGKDNRNICWNPKSGDILGELPQSHNWAFDIQWSPRNPNVLSSSSYDGKVSLYSILASDEEKPSSAVEANDDPFSTNVSPSSNLSLKQPPKWFRRPVGATFGFGGQLIKFSHSPQKEHIISINTIVSEPTIKERAQELKEVLEANSIEEFFSKKATQSIDEKFSWDIIKLLFEEDSRKKIVDMLGANSNLSPEELSATLTKLNLNKDLPGQNGIQSKISEENVTESEPKIEEETEVKAESEVKEETDNLFSGDDSKGDDDFFSKPMLEVQSTSEAVEELSKIISDPFSIDASGSDLQSLLSKLIVVGDFKTAVKACLNSDHYADALLIAMVGGGELLETTKKQIFKLRRGEAPYVRLLEGVVDGNLEDVVHNADLEDWDKVLTMICTYSQGEDFSTLTEKLGVRLSTSSDKPESIKNALLCFLLSGNIEKVVNIWVSEYLSKQSEFYEANSNNVEQPSPTSNHLFFNSEILQELIEKISLFVKAVDFKDVTNQQNHESSEIQTNSKLSVLYTLYYEYAEFLISQGLFDIAAKYLNLIPAWYKKPSDSTLDDYAALKYRLYYSGINIETFDPSDFPFSYNEIGAPSQEHQAQSFTSQPKEATNNYDNQYQNYSSQQSYQTSQQEPYYGGNYQQYSQPLDQTSTNQLYNQTASNLPPAQDMSSLYNPYPNYPPATSGTAPYPNYQSTNNLMPGYPGAPVPEIQESITPPSAQRNVQGWNDPPTEVFASKQAANKSSAKSTVLTNPFGTPAPPTMPTPNNQGPPQFGVNKNLPPPPQGGKAPTPLYSRSNQTISSHPPQPQHISQSGQNVNQHIGFQQPRPTQPPVQTQATRPAPPQASQPPQKPLYQTNPVKPSQPAPPSLSAQRIPGPPTPHPVRGPVPAQNQMPPRGPPNQSQTPQQQPPVPRNQPAPIDRTKMPPKYKPLFELLSRQVGSLKVVPLQAPQMRMFVDVEKKLNQLFDTMNQDQLATSLLEPLNEFGKALDAKDYGKAINLHSQLVSTQVNQVGPWVAGLKHLVTLLRSKP